MTEVRPSPSQETGATASGAVGDVPAAGRGALRSLAASVRRHPLGAAGISLVVFVAGAVAGSFIDRGLAAVLPDEAAELAREQQKLIFDRTDHIGLGVQQLQNRIEALSSSSSGAELEAIRTDAGRILADLRELTPIVTEAASRNASLASNLRASELARTGASATAALVLADNSSATVCDDFTVGVRRYDDDRVNFALSRRGRQSDGVLTSGQTVALELPDASASVSFAGIRSVDPPLYGVDFNCYSGVAGP